MSALGLSLKRYNRLPLLVFRTRSLFRWVPVRLAIKLALTWNWAMNPVNRYGAIVYQMPMCIPEGVCPRPHPRTKEPRRPATLGRYYSWH